MTDKTTKTYLSKVQVADNGQLAVDMPAELFESLSWKPGDTLAWAVLPDGNGFVVSKMEA